MTGIVPTTFAGVALQTAGYVTWLERPDAPYTRDSNPVMHVVSGKLPRYVRSDPLGTVLVLHVTILTGGFTAVQDAIADIFPIGLSADLVVDFDGSSRRVAGIVKQLVPMDGGAPNRYAVVLTVPDPRWRSAALQTNATGFPAGGVGLVNAGNADEDEVLFAFLPGSAKPLTNAWGYRREVYLANRVPRTYINEAINVVGTSFDHATLVGAGKSQADGDDVRVFLDGIETNRWRGEAVGTTWNQATTALWCNVTMSPRLTAVLTVACASGVSPATGGQISVQKGDTSAWPNSGAFLIETEVITYTGKTDSAFTGITRGARGSSAAAHAISPEVTLFWIERRVQVVYGHASVTAPAANDHLKPLLDLALSTNTLHVWASYMNSRKPRSMQWSPKRDLTRDRQADHMAVKVSGVTSNGDLNALRLEYYQDPEKHDEQPGNIWARDFASPVSSLNLNFTNTAYQIVGVILAIDENGKERVVAECKNGSTTALGATALDNATRLAFYSRLYTAIQSYDATSVPASVDLSTLLPETNEHREPVVIPELARPVGYIEEVVLPLWVTGGNVDATLDFVVLTPGADPLLSASYVAVCVAKTINLVNTTQLDVRFVWGPGEFNSVRTDDVLYMRLRRTAASSGAQHLFWNGGRVLYMGATQAQQFTIQSLSLDQADNVLGGNGIFFSVGAVAATLAAATVPYVAVGPEAAIYNVNGVWTNTTTGQSVTLSAFCTLGDTLTLDVKNRTFVNTTQGGFNIFSAAAFSDPTNWITLVPGNNAFTWVEADVVGFQVNSTWSNRWA